MATARFHDFLFPSLHDDWVTTGDMLRVVAQWWCWRVCSTRWASSGAGAAPMRSAPSAGGSWPRSTTVSRRISRTSAPRAASRRAPATNEDHLTKLQQAADRALGEARRVIAAYSHGGDLRLGGVIAELSRDIEHRYGYHVVLDLDDDIIVDSHTAHEVGRIASEALANAARHARPKRISARLASRRSTSS